MYRKILVPLDGSVLAETVLPHVRMLAENHDTEILLLQVVVDPIYNLFLCGAKLAAASQSGASIRHAESRAYLNQVATRLQPAGIKVSTHIAEGIVTDVILNCARDNQVDLIVMTTRGTNTPSGWQLGTVAYRIVHDAQVPVLLVHTKQAPLDQANLAYTTNFAN